MAEINGEYLFAPGIPFSEVDVKSPALIHQFCARMDGLYIAPARQLANHNLVFPSGVLLVSCADALSRYDPRVPATKRTKNSERFPYWVRNNLTSFSTGDLAERFYKEFRNGLVHEARIKLGSAFSNRHNSTVTFEQEVMFVNVERLAVELLGALSGFHDHLTTSASDLSWFQSEFSKDFTIDLAKR